MTTQNPVSDQEAGFVLGQGRELSDVEKIAKKNREFEAQQAAKQRREIAEEIIETQKREKVTAARNRLLEMLVDGHEAEVRDFTDDLTADDRRELLNSLKAGSPAQQDLVERLKADIGDEDEGKEALSPEAQKIVDDVMAKK